jgi:cell division protein YceG involved in septum cleavage/N-acetylmuramoyl-L-alanine amidase/peptidoglycan hydrolase-like protein with peptidoglycan-binding domain
MTSALRGMALILATVVLATIVSGIAWREGERHLHQRGEPVAELRPRPVPDELIVWPGWRIEQVAHAASRATGASSGRLTALANNEELVERLGVPASSLEGYLAPGRYLVRPGTSEETLIAELVARFRTRWSAVLKRGAKRLDLTPREALTLASIVEREAARSSEMPTIASVFLSRLRLGMRLQSDATVLYAADTARGVGRDAGLYWRRDLEGRDFRFRSPYNTYVRAGLPPAPIAAPSNDAIRAVLGATPSRFLYFMAKGDGTHAFARTLREHENNVRRYRTESVGASSRLGGRAPLQGVHVPARAWADRSFRASLLKLIAESRVNAVELDLKEEDGTIGFDSKQPFARSIGAVRNAYSLRDAVQLLHSRGVRVIGRICAFGDPLYARAAWRRGRRDEVMQTPHGTRYVETGQFTNYAHPNVWRYNIDVATEAARAGVDEILYDYVRRPAGPIDSMVAPGLDGPPETAIVEFLSRSRKALRPYGVAQGASVFGIAARRPTDVAQDVRSIARVVDYVAPMLYPSLWEPGEFGLVDPEEEPFAIVQRSLEYFEAEVAGTGAELLPWLQDFSKGMAYRADEVAAQIAAARLAHTRGWLLWNARAAYTLRALKPVGPQSFRTDELRGQSPREWDLEGKLAFWTAGLGDRVGVVVKDLGTAEAVSVRGDEIFPVRGLAPLLEVDTPRVGRLRSSARRHRTLSRTSTPPARAGARRLTPGFSRAVSWATPLEVARLLERASTAVNPRIESVVPRGATHGIFRAAGRRVIVVVLAESAGGAVPRSSVRLTSQILRYLDAYDSQTSQLRRQRSPFCTSSPFRPTSAGPLAGKTIVLDPGHGGRDPGARFAFGDGVRLKESELVLGITLKLAGLLQDHGATVEMTRCRDAHVPLRWRADFANRADTDLFVSIHLNGSPDEQRNATETYYASDDGERPARYLFGTYTTPGLWGTLNRARRLENGGVQKRQFTVLREARAPSVLTESLYLTSPREAAALRWPLRRRSSRLDEIVRGHLRGIVSYFANPGTVSPADIPRIMRRRPGPTPALPSADSVLSRLAGLGYATPPPSGASGYKLGEQAPGGYDSANERPLFGLTFSARLRYGEPLETSPAELADAVYAFQKVQGLPRTGIVDAATRTALRSPRLPVPRHASPQDHLEVDKTRQVLYVIRNGQVRSILPISTAAPGIDFTPEGRFSVYRKKRGYDPSPLGTLYYPIYFVGPYAIHGSPSVPPYPASHGCVRIPMWAARALYQAQPFGETVYVY